MDIPQATDADMGFLGMASNANPASLQPGFYQYGEDVRMEMGRLVARGTQKRVLTGQNSVTSVRAACRYVDTDGAEWVVQANTSRIYAIKQDGTTTKSGVWPAGRSITPTDIVDMFQAGDRVYVLRDFRTGATFTGTWSQPLGLGNVVSITTSTNHGYSTGDEIALDADNDGYDGYYIVTVTGATTFNITLSAFVPGPASGNCTCYKAKTALYWDFVDGSTCIAIGFSQTGALTGTTAKFPASRFGMYFQNRIVACTGRNTIAASDLLDPNTWDLTLNQFTINLGGNDRVTGMHPWQDDKIVLFLRNSIYYAYIDPNSYTAGAAPGGNSYIRSLTTELGCNARNTIAAAGEFIFFLHDRGVYALTPTLDVKLLGNQEPISSPISDIISRINSVAAENVAYGCVWNNRYYLAVPLDGATTNNAILVYNLIHKQWESVDTFPANGCAALITAIYGNELRMWLVPTNSEHTYIYEGYTDVDQYNNPTTNQEVTLTPYVTSRQYSFGTVTEKRYSRYEVVGKGGNLNSADWTLTFTGESPDSNNLNARYPGKNEVFTWRGALRRRGYAGQITVGWEGAGQVRSFAITASVPGSDNRSDD